MFKVYSAATLPDAHMMRGLLAQAGIEARVFNENAVGGMGEIPFTHTYPEVWVVNERDLQPARDLIREFERPAANPGSVYCARCGETNPGNFQTCWNCGDDI
jgi:hypothetical protein